jgi:mono/diheme cytochrome c family protein
MQTTIPCTVMVALVAFALCALSGCKAKPSGKLESRMMFNLKHHLTVGNRKQKNPLPLNAESVDMGRQAFSHYCAACHGLDGQNTGVPFAGHMSPPVPSLMSKEVQSYSDGQLKSVIDNGIWPSGMPGSKGILSDEEIWSIVNYIRRLPPQGSLGEPQMYSQ